MMYPGVNADGISSTLRSPNSTMVKAWVIYYSRGSPPVDNSARFKHTAGNSTFSKINETPAFCLTVNKSLRQIKPI